MGLLVGLLVLVSALFRLPGLNVVPPELFGDEIDVGYQAYSLLKTGQDIYRHPMPIYLQSLAEWRLPLIVYQAVPSVAIFGLSEYGVRLPEAIFGALAPAILFLLVYELSRSKAVSFLGAAALAFMPWHIIYSRMAAFGVVTMADFIMLGVLLILKRRVLLSAIFFALAIYAYGTALIAVPILLVFLIVYLKNRSILMTTIATLVFVLPLVFAITFNAGSSRYGVVGLLADSSLVDSINYFRTQTNGSYESVFHNKPESAIRLFTNNYLRAFSTDLLFVRGDPVARHSLQVVGQLLSFSTPFLLIGLYRLVAKRKWLWVVWLGIAPIPAALTFDGAFHATRLFLMTIPLAVAFGEGIVASYSVPRAKWLATVVLIAVIGQFTWVSEYYVVHYPIESWRWWPTGYRQVLTDLGKVAGDYQHIFINNTYEPALMRFLFYTKYSPEQFHRSFTLDQPIAQIVPGYDGFSLDNKYFFGQFTPEQKASNYFDSFAAANLYLLSQRDDVSGDWDWRKSPPDKVKVLSTGTNLNDQPVLYLVTGK